MNCPFRSEEHTDQLLAYSAGKLRGEAAAKLELHMRACPECAALGEAQTNVWNLLDAWEVRPVSQDFNRNLYARIDAAASASWLERFGAAVNEFLRPVLAKPAFPLAAATLLIAAGFVFDHPGASISPKGAQVSLQASAREVNRDGSKADLNKVEVEQVESTLDDIEMLSQFTPNHHENVKTSASKSM